MGKTTKFQLPYPEESDVANVPADIKKLAEETEKSLTSLIDLIFPIGSVFIDESVDEDGNSTDYSNRFGFTWERTLQGVVPIGINANDKDFATVGQIGGEKTHTLTKKELPNVKGSFRMAGNVMTNISEAPLVYTAGIMEDNVMTNIENYATRPYINNNNVIGYVDNTHSNQINIEFGNNEAHNIMQPYKVVAYWKRVA